MPITRRLDDLRALLTGFGAAEKNDRRAPKCTWPIFAALEMGSVRDLGRHGTLTLQAALTASADAFDGLLGMKVRHLRHRCAGPNRMMVASARQMMAPAASHRSGRTLRRSTATGESVPGAIYRAIMQSGPGMSPDGLPIGVRIVGPSFEDCTPLKLARLMEAEFGGFVPPVDC